jgi:Tol biopolymer transport system component
LMLNACGSQPVVSAVTQESSESTEYANTSGAVVYAATDKNSTSQIFLVDVESHNTKQLTHSGYNTSPAWSPSGNLIAYSSRLGEKMNIYIMYSDGSEQHPVTNCSGFAGSPAWSPDENKIAFVSDCDGKNGIYVLDLKTKNISRITQEEGSYFTPDWSVDGKFILFAFAREQNKSDIYKMSIDGTNIERLTNEDFPATRPVWCPDGNCIIYEIGTGSHNKIPKLMIMDLTTRKSEKLLAGNNIDVDLEEWLVSRSPKRGYIALSLREEFYLLDLGNRQLHSLNLKIFGGSLYP